MFYLISYHIKYCAGSQATLFKTELFSGYITYLIYYINGTCIVQRVWVWVPCPVVPQGISKEQLCIVRVCKVYTREEASGNGRSVKTMKEGLQWRKHELLLCGKSPWQAWGLWWRVPVQRGTETMFDRSKLSGRGNMTHHYRYGRLLSCRAHKLYTHQVWGQMDEPLQTHICSGDSSPGCRTHTHTAETSLHCKDRWGELISVPAWQPSSSLALAYLYSVMLMQCHAGADYVKVSQRKA